MPILDISRDAFDPSKHYSSVRMQQGRVLTDDDWNEQARIEEEEQRRTQVDIIGGYGSPNQGFKIFPKDVTTTDGVINFQIHAGTIYVGGIRFEMDAVEFFRVQKDWLQKKDEPVPSVAVIDAMPDKQRFDLVYFEGWQQGVSAIEDDSLIEVALGGQDTTGRLRNMRRVKIYPDCGSPECPIAWKKLRSDWSDTKHYGKIKKYELIPDSKLTVSFTDEGAGDDLCTPATAGGYLGAENQAIRVQRTKGNFFTWGFDNASPLYRVELSEDGLTVTMKTPPKDQHHWPQSGQVIELLPWSAELPNLEKIAEHAGKLGKVEISYDPDTRKFSLPAAAPILPGDVSAIEQKYFYLRVWNRGTDLASPAEMAITPAPVVLGNTGLKITFSGPDSNDGDFWVIAARPSSPKIIVPWELTSTGIKPHGIRRFYAPLAIIQWTIDNGVVKGKVIHDCRKHFHPLTEEECCCTYTVGDGINSKGDFQKIQDAIDSLPDEGGKICVLRGIHEANVVIDRLKKIQISGCGEQTIVRSAADTTAPIFYIKRSQRIKLDNMTLFTLKGTAIKVEDTGEGDPSEQITIRDNRILAFVNAIHINLQINESGDNEIKILYNKIGMYDRDDVGASVAIFTIADDVLIEQNRIMVITAPPDDDGNPDPDPDPGGFHDPCINIKKTYAEHAKFMQELDLSLHDLDSYVAGGTPVVYKVPGGIQVGGGSEKVIILRNEIMKGRGNGITLGHEIQFVFEGPAVISSSSLYDITIEKNLIREMGLSGIGALLHPNLQMPTLKVHIENIEIIANNIMLCVQGEIKDEESIFISNFLPASAISLAYCEDCIIRENWLERNGKNQPFAVSGIFVFYTEKIDISNNRIINNGTDVKEVGKFNLNVRGGIVIMLAFKLPKLDKEFNISGSGAIALPANDLQPVFDIVPAAKIHDNIVSQPVGHALFLLAIGPVSVVSNQFTSQGINTGEKLSTLASTVFIFNLGISKDIYQILVLPITKWKYVNPAAAAFLAGPPDSASSKFLKAFQYFPSGKTMYTANQALLDLRSKEIEGCICSELVFTLDDLAFVNNQCECASLAILQSDVLAPLTGDLMLFNTILFSISTRCNDNRFTDGFMAVTSFHSLLSLGLLNTAVGNQASHCMLVPFWIFRRRGMNIEMTANDCDVIKQDSVWSHTMSPNYGNSKFNHVIP